MADPVLSKGQVARAQVGPNGLTGSPSGDIDALAVSHEALRAQRDEARRLCHELLETIDVKDEQHAALTAVARRLLDGWAPSEIVDDEGLWTKGLIPDGWEAEYEEWMTDAERAALELLERFSLPTEGDD